jgi:hypothetical protein
MDQGRASAARVSPMAEYRAFTIGRDGHFAGFEPIVCDTDDQAVERAQRMLHGTIEVWCGSRMVARLSTADKDCNAVSHEIHQGRMISKQEK